MEILSFLQEIEMISLREIGRHPLDGDDESLREIDRLSLLQGRETLYPIDAHDLCLGEIDSPSHERTRLDRHLLDRDDLSLSER